MRLPITVLITAALSLWLADAIQAPNMTPKGWMGLTALAGYGIIGGFWALQAMAEHQRRKKERSQ